MSTEIRDPQFEDALFIFNDNLVQHNTIERGSNSNDVIRLYNSHGIYGVRPRSAGIITSKGIPGKSSREGFKSLTPQVKKTIDASFLEIKELVKEHCYTRVFFPAQLYEADKYPRPYFGSMIIGEDVREHITELLYSLEV